ncbi:uncharacterized protein LOC136062203 [Quercus suber]|uniref:uncharacterized protein LOC136062203 n=1 Tax=Quercus suber TaxID=58331 RepID=UPI0032DFB5DD
MAEIEAFRPTTPGHSPGAGHDNPPVAIQIFPSLDAPLEEKQRYDRWQKSNEMTKCYILASILNVLQHQMQDVELASDIMLSLKEMFGEQGRSARQETMRQIYNTKMAEGTSVREHCLRMISNLNTLKVLGADIDGES